jgi:hypothetical protein
MRGRHLGPLLLAALAGLAWLATLLLAAAPARPAEPPRAGVALALAVDVPAAILATLLREIA